MKKLLSVQGFGVLALMCSSVGMAASVTVVASNATPTVGDTFTVTIHGDGFPATAGATLGLSFNNTVASFVSAALPASGPFSSASGAFLLLHPSSGTPTTFDILAPASGAAPSGSFDAAVFTFQAIAAGAPNIVFIDNASGAGTLAWFDANTFDPIPATYTQANDVTVGGATAPEIAVTDSVAPTDDRQIPFGTVTEDTSSTQTMTITNIGSADLVLGTLAQIDALATPFSLTNDNCSGQTLTPATPCTVDVVFSPAAIGAFSDSFDIPSNDPSEPAITFSLAGTGMAAPTPDIAVTDSVAPDNDRDVPFGDITQGGLSTQTVTVTNNGSATLILGVVASADPLAAPFSVANDQCSDQSLVPAAACTFQVQFLPVAVGPFNDTLDIPSNDPDTASVSLTVSGTGTPVSVPDITVTDSVTPFDDLEIGFGDVNVSTSPNETVTVTNDGAEDLVMGNVAAANSLAAPFSIVADTCSGETLAPTATCSLTVEFAPGAAQVFNDSFDIPSNDPDEATVTIAVSGTGQLTDPDGDGIDQSVDNCLDVANADQRDTDGDGYGNLCDADLNNSGGIVNFADLALFRAAFGSVNSDADFNGNGGAVDFADLATFRTLFGKAPGPSGIVP